MVQVLPAVPGFGEQLGQALTGALGNIGQGLINRRDFKQDQNILGQMASNPSVSPLQQIQSYAALSPQLQNTLGPVFSEFIKSSQRSHAAGPEASSDAIGLKTALDKLDDNIEFTGTTALPGTKSFLGGSLNRDAREKREEFDTLGFWSTDQVFTHFNKGTISKDKLKTLKDDLAPNSKLSERQNKARINSLRVIANLPKDVSEKEFDQTVAKQKKVLDKIGAGSEKPSLTSFFR